MINLFASFTFSILTMTLVMASNPVSLVIMIILQSLWIATFANALKETFWLGYILILIYLGGMLIIFAYICSLAPNEKFGLMKLNTFILLSPPIMYLTYENPLNINLNEYHFCNIITLFSTNYLSLLLLLFYLLFSLSIVTFVTNFKSGPLQHKTWFFMTVFWKHLKEVDPSKNLENSHMTHN